MTFKIGDKVTIRQEATDYTIYHDQVKKAKKLQEVGEIVDINIGISLNHYLAKFPSIPVPLWITGDCFDLVKPSVLAVDPFDIIKDLCG